MLPDVYWIEGAAPGRLATMPRPRAGDWLEGEIRGLRQLGVDVVVCLLTAEEVRELGLQEEEALCSRHDIRFVSYPIPDFQVPSSLAATRALVKELSDYLDLGQGVAIHCHMGIGRSSLIAASVLAYRGVDATEAFARISRARGLAVPDTPEQMQWVSDLATTFAPQRHKEHKE